MTIQLKVPTIACDGCSATITKAILAQEPEAKVDINVENKVVQVETQASEESVKQMIVAAGHQVE